MVIGPVDEDKELAMGFVPLTGTPHQSEPPPAVEGGE
jgi:hypothetical protein